MSDIELTFYNPFDQKNKPCNPLSNWLALLIGLLSKDTSYVTNNAIRIRQDVNKRDPKLEVLFSNNQNTR